MRARFVLVFAAALSAGAMLTAQAPKRFNPMVELLAAKKPVFGLYAPSNRRFGGGPGGPGGARPAPPADAPPPKTPAQLGKEAVDYANSDFIFDGSMEGNFETAAPQFQELMNGISAVGLLIKSPQPRLSKAVVVKMNEIAGNAKATENIGRQLNMGVTGIMFVSAESAEEVQTGINAMRFTSKGGTRSENVGNAPAVWGMSEKEYKEKAVCHRAARDVDAVALQALDDLVVRQHVAGGLGLDHGADAVAHRFRGVSVAVAGRRDGRGEEIFELEQAAIGRHVFIGGDPAHGRFMHRDRVGDGLEVQWPQVPDAIGKKRVLLAHDLLGHFEDGAGALVETLD
jgi:hypothetical protein